MKIILRPLSIALIAVLMVVALYFYSGSAKNYLHGFSRKLPPHIVSDYRVYDLGVNSWFLAGFTGNNIYLGNSTVPNRILRISTTLTDSTEYYIPLDADDTLWGNIRVAVDSPGIVFLQSNPFVIRKASFDGSIVTKTKPDIYNLLELQSPSNHKVIGRRFDFSANATELFTGQITDLQQMKTRTLAHTRDSIFVTDGLLAFAENANSIFYVHFYDNQVTCLDTNLQIVYTTHTIDTISHPSLQIEPTHNDTHLTLSARPNNVNKTAFCSDSLLFVQSAVRGDHEDAKGFLDNMVIDTYSAISGKYLFSFYIAPYKGFYCRSIKAYKQHIYAVFDRYLVSIQLSLNNFRGALR